VPVALLRNDALILTRMAALAVDCSAKEQIT
jgi:hypothetical protein